MRYFSTVFIVLLTITTVNLTWSDTKKSFTLGGTQIYTLESTAIGEAYELVISLPSSYSSSPKQKYPVLYFLDGYWDTPLVYATYGNLSFDRAIPEIILVGLSLPEGRQIGQFRDKFFSPTEKTNKPQSGQAHKLYKMLKTETIPFVEKHFRTNPSPKYRALAGQSMGGLFTLSALYQPNNVFTRFIAINPAISWDTQYMLQLNKHYAKAHKNLPAKVFVSYGGDEFAPFRDAAVAFQSHLKKSQYQDLQLQVRPLNGMRHTGGKGEAYARGLLWVFSDLAPTGKSGLEAIW